MRQSALLGSTNSTRKRWEYVEGRNLNCNNFVVSIIGFQEFEAFHHWNIIKSHDTLGAGIQHGFQRTNSAMFFCWRLWYWTVSALTYLQDSFQEHYTETGRYPGPIVSPPRRPWSLINWLFWSCLLLYPLGLLLAQLISSGSMLTILASVALCSAGWFCTFKPQGEAALKWV